MPENKGKPSGKYAESKQDVGRKGNYQRTGWPDEEAIRPMPKSRRKSTTQGSE
jgi:hypothetical protein